MKSQMHQFLDTQPAYRPYRETGFVDNYQASLGQFFDENMTTSRWLNEGPIRESKNNIFKLRESGKITDQEINMFDREDMDWDSIINYVNKKFSLNYPTHTKIRENIREELKGRREYAQGIYNDATGLGMIGRYAGSFHAAVLDPVTFPTLFIGLGAATKGASMIARFSKGAAIAGTVEGAAEVAIQPFVYSWKNEIGSDYSMKDALTSIAAVTLGAGFLGGIGGTVAGAKIKKPKMDFTIDDLSVGHFRNGMDLFLSSNASLARRNPTLMVATQSVRRISNLLKGVEVHESVTKAFDNYYKAIQNVENPHARAIPVSPLETVSVGGVSSKVDTTPKVTEVPKAKPKETDTQLQEITDELNKIDLENRKGTIEGQDLRNKRKLELEAERARIIAAEPQAKPVKPVFTKPAKGRLDEITDELNKIDLENRKGTVEGQAERNARKAELEKEYTKIVAKAIEDNPPRPPGPYKKRPEITIDEEPPRSFTEAKKAVDIAKAFEEEGKVAKEAVKETAEEVTEEAEFPAELADSEVPIMRTDEAGNPVLGKDNLGEVEEVKPLKTVVEDINTDLQKLADAEKCLT